MKRIIFLYAIFGLMLLLLPQSSKAVELITNGSFETGNLNGWTAVNGTGFYRQWQTATAGQGGNVSCVCGITFPTTTSPQDGTVDAWNGVTANANSPFTLSQDVTLVAGRLARMDWKDRFQMNLSQFCSTPAQCGTASYFVEILNTSNVLLQTLYSVTAPSLVNTDTGWVTHSVNLSAFAGQTIRVRFRDFTTVTFVGPGQAEIDAVSVQSLVPTAANASVGGRVLTNDGSGISRMNVILTDGTGNSRSVSTNSFGFYKFDDVTTGGTYVLTVSNKKYLFTDSPRVVNVQDNLSDIDFRASP
jgi:hypothetical protein